MPSAETRVAVTPALQPAVPPLAWFTSQPPLPGWVRRSQHPSSYKISCGPARYSPAPHPCPRRPPPRNSLRSRRSTPTAPTRAAAEGGGPLLVWRSSPRWSRPSPRGCTSAVWSAPSWPGPTFLFIYICNLTSGGSPYLTTR